MTKPRTAAGYDSSYVRHVRDTSLYLATKLGDLIDELVIVGGLVPSLLIDQAHVANKHVGTLDLDIGMQVAILNNHRYEALTERLRSAGFGPDETQEGHPTRQRWKINGPPKVTIDFLIPPSHAGDSGGQLRNIEKDFAAIIAPGLHLAFVDLRRIALDGRTIRGEKARREVSVCGPGAFVARRRSRCVRGVKTRTPMIWSTYCKTSAKGSATWRSRFSRCSRMLRRVKRFASLPKTSKLPTA